MPCLDFGGDHRKAAAGFAGARRLDGGIQRQHRGLSRDLCNQIDHVADRRRRLLQTVDVLARLARGGAGFIRKPPGIAHSGADIVGRVGEFLGRPRKSLGGGTRTAGPRRERASPLPDLGQRL
jgi:hypothetical protein